MGHRSRTWLGGVLLAGVALASIGMVAGQEAGPDLDAILATGTTDGQGVPTYVVRSPEDQARVLEALGLEALSQALVFDEDGTPYDVVETSAGTIRFEVSAFVGGEGP